MTERDRLAALLHDLESDLPCTAPGQHLDDADFLIAAGVGFPADLATRIVAAVERLERHTCEPCESDDEGWAIDRAAVLGAIREASE